MRESKGEKSSSVSDKIIKTALKVCEKRLRELDDLIDDPNAFTSLVTEEEWAILGADELNIESLAKQKHENWLAKNEVMQQEKKKQDKKEEKKKKKKKRKPKILDNEEIKDNEEAIEGWGSEQKQVDDEEDEDDIDEIDE